LNEVLVAPARPDAAAVRVHPVHRPVTCRLLNVAMPSTAFTLVWPLRPPATTGPSSVRDTRAEKPVAVAPWASRAVTSTENVPFRTMLDGGLPVNTRFVAGGGGGGGGAVMLNEVLVAPVSPLELVVSV
jgi:hypothetical protein